MLKKKEKREALIPFVMKNELKHKPHTSNGKTIGSSKKAQKRFAREVVMRVIERIKRI